MSILNEADFGIVIDDVCVYLKEGYPDGALDMLVENEPSLAVSPQRFMKVAELIDLVYRTLVFGGRSQTAEQALRLLFRIARISDLAFAAVEHSYLDIYVRALVASKTSALPLHRAVRQSRLAALFRDCEAGFGSVAECGCARGNSFLQLCFLQVLAQPKFQGEDFLLLDSFQGLSEPRAEDLDITGFELKQAQRILAMTHFGSMAYGYEEVSAQIWAPFPRVAIHRGWLPESLKGLDELRYRFVHIDVDLYEPTLGCFEYFYPRLVPGGVIVTDDYNWPGGRRAVDHFCARHGLRPSFTASHQAFLVAA
jgi:hypothetical protein